MVAVSSQWVSNSQEIEAELYALFCLLIVHNLEDIDLQRLFMLSHVAQNDGLRLIKIRICKDMSKSAFYKVLLNLPSRGINPKAFDREYCLLDFKNAIKRSIQAAQLSESLSCFVLNC